MPALVSNNHVRTATKKIIMCRKMCSFMLVSSLYDAMEKQKRIIISSEELCA